MGPKLAIVEERSADVRTLSEMFQSHGFELLGIAHSLAEARQHGLARMADIILIDRSLHDGDGLAYAAELRATAPGLAVFVFSDDTPPPLLPRGVHYLHNDARMQWPSRILATM